jgi:L-fuconolactonase
VIVDAHQHFWDPARADYPWMTDGPLRRRFGPEHLAPLLREHGVAGTVVVQARHELAETRELLALAAATPFVLGVVGWVDLTGDVRAQLAGLEGPLVGVRHLTHDEPDPRWLLRDDVQRGLAAVAAAGLAFDLLVRERELPAAVETARRRPELRLVLDHVAKAPADPAAHARWRDGIRALAGAPNVACKLSGLHTEADPEGTLALALREFGPERCLFGSDWPVCTLATDYGAALDFVRTRAPASVLAETAIRTYALPR